MHTSVNQQHQQQHKLLSIKRVIKDDHGYRQLSENRMVYDDLSATDLFANALFGLFSINY